MLYHNTVIMFSDYRGEKLLKIQNQMENGNCRRISVTLSKTTKNCVHSSHIDQRAKRRNSCINPAWWKQNLKLVLFIWFSRSTVYYICRYFICFLTLSSPGFFGSSQPGGAQSAPPPHHNFFVIGRIMMRLGKLVKCSKLYLMMGFWWVNWLWRHNDVIAYGISV